MLTYDQALVQVKEVLKLKQPHDNKVKDIVASIIANTRLTPKEKIDLFSIPLGEDLWTLGMIVARYQNATTQAFLSFLSSLLEDKTVFAQDILKLLMQQNKNDWTLGIFVARHQDAATTQAYLRLLSSLLEDKTVSARDILKLLMQQTKGGWTLGMNVAQYQDAVTTQAYLRFLSSLLEDKTVSAQDILKLLMQQTKEDKLTLGMYIALQDAVTTQAYLRFLSSLLEDKTVSAQDILPLLLLQEKDGWTLGIIVAREQDAATTQAYLRLLSSLLEDKTVSAQDILKLLMQQNETGWTLGMNVARYQDVVTTQAFLSLLSSLLEDKTVSAQDILKLLMQQNETGSTFGMNVARYQDAATMQAFLSLLSSLLEDKTVSAQDILKLLLQQNKTGWTLGMIVAWYQDIASCKQYIELIIKLQQLGVPSVALQELIDKTCTNVDDASKNTFTQMILSKHPQLILELETVKLLPEATFTQFSKENLSGLLKKAYAARTSSEMAELSCIIAHCYARAKNEIKATQFYLAAALCGSVRAKEKLSLSDARLPNFCLQLPFLTEANLITQQSTLATTLAFVDVYLAVYDLYHSLYQNKDKKADEQNSRQQDFLELLHLLSDEKMTKKDLEAHLTRTADQRQFKATTLRPFLTALPLVGNVIAKATRDLNEYQDLRLELLKQVDRHGIEQLKTVIKVFMKYFDDKSKSPDTFEYSLQQRHAMFLESLKAPRSQAVKKREDSSEEENRGFSEEEGVELTSFNTKNSDLSEESKAAMKLRNK